MKTKSYLDRIHESKIICGQMCDFKFRVFRQLYFMSILSVAVPRDPLNTEGGAGGAPIPMLERRAKYTVKRLALLNYCRDDDEMRFLDYYARDGADILRDIDDGYWNFDFARRMLNSALLDICDSLKERTKR